MFSYSDTDREQLSFACTMITLALAKIFSRSPRLPDETSQSSALHCRKSNAAARFSKERSFLRFDATICMAAFACRFSVFDCIGPDELCCFPASVFDFPGTAQSTRGLHGVSCGDTRFVAFSDIRPRYKRVDQGDIEKA